MFHLLNQHWVIAAVDQIGANLIAVAGMDHAIEAFEFAALFNFSAEDNHFPWEARQRVQKRVEYPDMLFLLQDHAIVFK